VESHRPQRAIPEEVNGYIPSKLEQLSQVESGNNDRGEEHDVQAFGCQEVQVAQELSQERQVESEVLMNCPGVLQGPQVFALGNR